MTQSRDAVKLHLDFVCLRKNSQIVKEPLPPPLGPI